MFRLRRLKLHGQNAPKKCLSTALRKNSPFGGDLKHKNQKSREKQLTGPFSFIFNKTDCPGK